MCVNTYTVDELISAYINIRDKKAELKAEFAERQKPYDEALFKIERAMLEKLTESGAESMKTPCGTAYKSIRTSVTIADKSAFLDFITEKFSEALANGSDPKDALAVIDLKANKTAIEDYLSTFSDVPPGVNIRREEVVGFRRA